MPPKREIHAAIVEVLAQESPMTAREIASVLAASGISVDKSRVNKTLYGDRMTFWHEGEPLPFWSLASRRPATPEPVAADWLTSLGLYDWQRRALDGWATSGHRGVVEAVTGSGKTRLALAAIAAEIQRGGRVAAIVPTTDLQGQWYAEIGRHLLVGASLRATIGLLGDGREDTLADRQVVVATAQSACNWQLNPPSTGALLIADEVHHLGAPTWARALEDGFDRRLGLTATYERDDGGVEAVLDPYFGSYRYSLGYEEAIRDGVIAHFKVAFVGVPFAPGEADEYAEQDERARKKRSLLVNQYGLTPEPFGAFMREVAQFAKSGEEGSKQAGLYLSAFSKRRQLLARASGKFAKLGDLAPAMRAASRTILFTQTVEAAERAVAIAERRGVQGGVVHATMERPDRQGVFDAFRDGDVNLIAAPKLLDEGIDVPDADLAIVLSSSRSRRQMIQRMGRVVRRKADGRLARLAVLFVEGTSEDPREGAHEDFIQLVVDAADDQALFDSRTSAIEVVRYLNQWV